MKHNALSFHKRALPAAEAALAAHAQGKFWEMHEKLFENMKELSDEDLEAYADEVGLDMVKYKAAMAAHTYKPQVEADMKLAGEVNAKGTPAFFVNGRNIRAGATVDDFSYLIDQELKKAKRRVKRGTPAKDVYNQIMAKGKIFEPLNSKVNKMSDAGRPFKGAANGDIVLYEFSDFQ